MGVPRRNALALLAVGTVLSLPGVSAASCAMPSIHFTPERARSGQAITLTGGGWASCPDPSFYTGGCWKKDPVVERSHPWENITLQLIGPVTQNGHPQPGALKKDLGEFDADENGEFSLEATLPKVPSGIYIIKSSRGYRSDALYIKDRP